VLSAPAESSPGAAARLLRAPWSVRHRHVLGLSAFYHDSAACLLRDGEIVAAAQGERFTRKKGDAAFPAHAAAYCLRAAGIAASDVEYVGFYDKLLLKFERFLETYLGVAPFAQGSALAPFIYTIF
jgi:carbamoyltransferase